ncbi:MAG: ketosteroid isomerase-like protein [Planctomycetota bacterium]|jgi:ketosteroid isomerase-like protein
MRVYMEPAEFVTEYGRALATQDWSKVAPLMHADVCVTFSSGAVHQGIDAVQKAFEGELCRDQE